MMGKNVSIAKNSEFLKNSEFSSHDRGTRMKSNRLAGALLILGLTLSVALALAAGQGPPRALVGSGGGALSGDGLRLRAAIGQPLAGRVENGMTLCSGFLCGPGAPIGEDEEHTISLPLVVR
jgi:hypothetical protein